MTDQPPPPTPGTGTRADHAGDGPPTPPPSASSPADAAPTDDTSGPRLPTVDELGAFHPATDLFVAFLDELSSRTLGRPLRPRLKLSPGMLRGEIDVVKLELPAYAVAGLVLDRFVIRAERVRVVPGLPPTLVAGPVRFDAVVGQENVDAWIRSLRAPVRLVLTETGVVTTTGFGGIRVTEVLTRLDVSGQFLRLRPQRASLLGLTTPLVRFLRGYLPLPPLPREAQLDAVDHRDGEIMVRFVVEEFRQSLTPDVTARMRTLLRLPLPGLR